MNAARCTQIGIDLSLYSGKTRSCLRHKCIPLVERIGPAAARIA